MRGVCVCCVVAEDDWSMYGIGACGDMASRRCWAVCVCVVTGVLWMGGACVSGVLVAGCGPRVQGTRWGLVERLRLLELYAGTRR